MIGEIRRGSWERELGEGAGRGRREFKMGARVARGAQDSGCVVFLLHNQLLWMQWMEYSLHCLLLWKRHWRCKICHNMTTAMSFGGHSLISK
jgi:hypothetical protein